MPASEGYTLDGSYILSQIRQSDGNWVITLARVAVRGSEDDIELVDEVVATRPFSSIGRFSDTEVVARFMRLIQESEVGVSRSHILERTDLVEIRTTNIILDRKRWTLLSDEGAL